MSARASGEKIDLPAYTKDEFYADLMRVTRVPELAELVVNESITTQADRAFYVVP